VNYHLHLLDLANTTEGSEASKEVLSKWSISSHSAAGLFYSFPKYLISSPKKQQFQPNITSFLP
jgi:hypothetical protein